VKNLKLEISTINSKETEISKTNSTTKKNCPIAVIYQSHTRVSSNPSVLFLKTIIK